MSDKMAYDIVKTLFEKKPELVAVHKEAENIELKNQTITSPMPFHPGRQEVPRGAGRQVAVDPDGPGRSGALRDASRLRPDAHRRRSTVVRCSDRRAAAQKAEAFIEAGRGRRSAAIRGWLAHRHDAPARRHVRCSICTRRSRSCRRRCCGPCTSASCCCSCSCCSRSRAAYRNRLMWWDVACAALGVATIAYLLAGGDDFWDRNTLPTQLDVCVRRRVRAARAGGLPPHVRLDHARSSSRCFLAYALLGPLAAGPMGASRLRRREHDRASVPDARRHLRHGGRRLVVADHPVHDLRRVPAAIGRRQVLPRFQLRRDGRQAAGRRPHRRARRRSCWADRRGRVSRRR